MSGEGKLERAGGNPQPISESERLSQLATSWTLIVRAHQGGEGQREALAELLPRYCGAVYRYVLGIIRDETMADDICQEFAYRFTRGDFRHAKRENGRFRDYIKVSVLHLVAHHRQLDAARRAQLPYDSAIAASTAAESSSPEKEFQNAWRGELLNKAWSALKAECHPPSPTLYDVLRYKAENPSDSSAVLAAAMEERFGRALSTANARQMLHRARSRFSQLLREEVAASIQTTDSADIDAELADLGLLIYFDRS